MAEREELFGTDLRLLTNLAHQAGRARGSDLSTVVRPDTGVDLDRLSGTGNLEQALLLRLLTPVGELALLGHPDYGSRLYDLIGELNTQANRNRAKMYVLQALAGESRIQQVLSVTVTQGTFDRTEIDIAMSLRVIDRETPLDLVVPFFLGGGVAP